MSTLEDLWNKGKLKPESYPQLIRMLQRERNTAQEYLKEASLAIAKLRNHVKEVREQIAEERRVIESNKH